MRSITAFILSFIFSLSIVCTAHAQSSETIWLTAAATLFKTGETVVITVNAVSVTPIQGFTFQVRYDPACLSPESATSPIPGMNGLSLPQTSGLVDASFASTVPQTVNGILAEVRFVTLGGCQTSLTLESAALAVRNESGFAVPLPGVTLGMNNISLNIDSAMGVSQPQAISGTPLALDPSPASSAGARFPVWAIAVFTVLFIVVLGFGINKAIQKIQPEQTE